MLNIIINDGSIDKSFNIASIKQNSKDVVILDNNSPPIKLIEAARYYWLCKDLDYITTVITYSDYFIKEINSLIMISALSNKQRLEVLEEYTEYKQEMFVNSHNITTNIKCWDGPNLCELDVELGFTIPSFDKVIDRQNNVQEFIFWSLN